MSIRTIYTCDKCGAEQKTQEQFWTVGVTANTLFSTSDYFVSGMSIQVCRLCLESFGIYVQKRQFDDPPTPTPPTLEDLIIELVQRASEH